MKKFLFTLLIIFSITAISCKKAPGEGGEANIIGNIWAQKWNATHTVMAGEGPGADVNVFIIYGSDITYGNKTTTNPDGTFEFQYLRPGQYTIYAYSKTPVTATNPNGKIAIYVNTQITSKKQNDDVGRIQVNI